MFINLQIFACFFGVFREFFALVDDLYNCEKKAQNLPIIDSMLFLILLKPVAVAGVPALVLFWVVPSGRGVRLLNTAFQTFPGIRTPFL